VSSDDRSGFDENGYCKPGTYGRSHHLGDPLTAEQIRELPDGAEVVITWCGGNGPHPYRVLLDSEGQRRVESLYPDLLLEYDGIPPARLQKKPLHRVTLGWDEATREWAESHVPEPEHIRESWARLRGVTPRG
jgi:hypothetical protein